jgi:hypothetical protein
VPAAVAGDLAAAHNPAAGGDARDSYDTYSAFRSAGLALSASCSFGKSAAESGHTSQHPDGTASKSAASTAGAVVVATLYGSMLAWQWNWIQTYQHIPPLPVPHKYFSRLRHKSPLCLSCPLLQVNAYRDSPLQAWIRPSEIPIASLASHLKAVKIAAHVASLQVRSHSTIVCTLHNKPPS